MVWIRCIIKNNRPTYNLVYSYRIKGYPFPKQKTFYLKKDWIETNFDNRSIKEFFSRHPILINSNIDFNKIRGWLKDKIILNKNFKKVDKKSFLVQNKYRDVIFLSHEKTIKRGKDSVFNLIKTYKMLNHQADVLKRSLRLNSKQCRDIIRTTKSKKTIKEVKEQIKQNNKIYKELKLFKSKPDKNN